MNITKKRLNKIKKTKNQSKRYIHKNNKKNKKNKTIKNKRKAYNLKNKSFKILKKRKRKYKGGENETKNNKKNTGIYLKLWTPLVDIEGEFELWTPFDDIEFDDIKGKINTSIIRGDDGTSKKDSKSKIEENIEEDKAFQKTNTIDNDKANLTKNSKKKKAGIFSRFSKNKPIKLKEYDEKKHEKLMEVLKASDKFNNLIDAIKKNIQNIPTIKDEPNKDEFYFQIHNQLMNTKLFENFVKDFEETDDYNDENGINHIAEKFTKIEDNNIKNIIQLIKGNEEKGGEKEGKKDDGKGGDNGEENEDDGKGKRKEGDNGMVGGSKQLLKWINDLKKDLKDAELGAHLKEVVRLPKKNLLLTLNFVEDTKENNENNEKNKNKQSQDTLTTAIATQTDTNSMLNQLILELGDHIIEANKIKDGDKGQTSDNNEGKTIDQ